MTRIVCCSLVALAAISFFGCGSAAVADTVTIPLVTPTGSPVSNFDPGPGWLSPAVGSGRELLYVAEERRNEIVIFHKNDRNSAPIGYISKGVRVPYGLYVDAEDSLYVANQATSTVSVYRLGKLAPEITYSAGLSRPFYPLADRTQVYVGNANTGTIAVFKMGSTKLVGTLKTLGTEVDGLNFGPSGEIYAAYRMGNGAGGVEKFPPGGFGQGLDLGIGLNGPQGIALDDFGNLLAVETQGTNRIDLFHPGRKSPAKTVSISGVPTQVQLGAGHDHLYVSTLYSKVFTAPYPRFEPASFWGFDALHDDIQGIALTPTSKP